MVKIKTKKTNIFILLILITAVFSLLFFNLLSSVANADGCDKYDGEKKTKCLQDQLKEYEKKATAYNDIIDIKNKQQSTIEKQMLLLDIEQQRNQIELRKTQAKAEDLSQQIADLEKEIIYKENLVKYQQLILAGLMQTYYEYDQEGVLGLVLMNENLSGAFNQVDYIGQSSDKVSDVLKIIQKEKMELQERHDELKNKKDESERVKKELENKNLTLQENENQKASLLAKTQGEEAKYQKLLNSVLEKQRQIEQEIYQIESGKAGIDLGPLPPAKSGLLAYPVNPVVITQGYGKTSFSKHYASGKHNGIDFSIKYGNIYAAKGGKVIATGNNGKYAYGKWIAVDHGNNLVTLYGHLSNLNISKGDSVKTGEKIGISGNTGFSTGPHLHFSVFSKKTFEITESKIVDGLMIPNGSSLNPKNYL